MAQIFNSAVMTDSGAALLAAAQAGTATLNFTAVVTGDGVHTDKSVDHLRTLTSLLSQKQSFGISDVDIVQDVSVQMTSILTNAALATGYYLNEIGLLCQDGDDASTSTLFSIAVTSADQGDYFPSASESSGVEITQHFIITTSNTANITVQMGSDVYALKEDLDDHVDDAVKSTAGAHGLRYHSDALQYYDTDSSDWESIPLGGSQVKVITEDSALFGATVTLTCNDSSITGTMSNSGVCEFVGVPFIGTVSVSAVNGGSSGTDSISIPYYGIYESEVATGVINVLSITTTEPTLYGKTVTATYGAKTKTATFSGSGTATIKVIDYLGDVNLSSTDGADTATAKVTVVSGTTEYSVSMAFYELYGAEWDGSSTTRWSRTDDAADFTDPVPAVSNGSGSSPFDACYPWKDIVKESRTGGVMVKIPKFWYKITQNGAGMKVQIASAALDGFSVSPAHMDRGDGKGERDYVYVGRYKSGSSGYKSTSGQTPYVNATRSAMRTALHNLGSTLWQEDFATAFTRWLLYIVEFADWNSQAKIGYGCAPNGSTSAVRATGYTDAMQYHTGTDQASRTTYGGTQYRWMEGLWDNCYEWLDGCYYDSNGLNIIKNPSNFSDSSGGTPVGVPSSGYPSAFTVKDVSGTFPCFIPTTSSGSDSTYSCDDWDFSASYPCLYAGGSYGQVLNRGLFFVGCNAASYSGAVLGCRLLELP